MSTISAELMARVQRAMSLEQKAIIAAEVVDEQVKNEHFLEELFEDCKTQLGVEHSISIDVFFILFDSYISMYRLDKIDVQLVHVVPAVDRFGAAAGSDPVLLARHFQYKLKLIQCIAFTRWKQHRFSEAMDGFLQMETMTADSPSPHLFENMAHTYSSMSNYPKAKEYFEKCLAAGTPNRTGTLLGLGLLSERTGDLPAAMEQLMAALEAAKATRVGDKEGSIEGKVAMSIAKLQVKLKDPSSALTYASMAVDVFRHTCGEDSPLLASALKIKGEVLCALPEQLPQACDTFIDAFRIEAQKDLVELMTMMELVQLVQGICRMLPAPSDCSHRLKETCEIGLRACQHVRNKLPLDGNAAAFFKCVGELAVHALDLKHARELFVEAVPLFREEKSMDCSNLVAQCTEIISLIDSKLKGDALRTSGE